MKKSLLIELIRALIILLFLSASLSKFISIKGFEGDMRNQVFPMWMAEVLTIVVPVTEIIIVGLLYFDKTRLIGFYASAVLMTLFTIYTATVLTGVYGRIPCSCGGVIRKLSWKQHMILNIFFVLISLIAIAFERKIKILPRDNAGAAENL